jgi:hypothetical protein
MLSAPLERFAPLTFKCTQRDQARELCSHARPVCPSHLGGANADADPAPNLKPEGFGSAEAFPRRWKPL